MLKKFADGLVFGAGFGISLAVVWLIATAVLLPHAATSHMSPPPTSVTTTSEGDGETREMPTELFHELPIEEQIKASSVIALASYEPAEDGRMKAVLKEFLKKDADVTFYYELGDEYRPSSYYPKPNTSYGDGIVIFFEGSPAMMRRAMSYSGDRIMSLGDMPMKLLRNKCSKESA
jgi:hypothetical protein